MFVIKEGGGNLINCPEKNLSDGWYFGRVRGFTSVLCYKSGHSFIFFSRDPDRILISTSLGDETVSVRTVGVELTYTLS